MDAPTKTVAPIRVHMFWAYGPLSDLERICLASFTARGYAATLWTYDAAAHGACAAEVRDARELLPETRIFTYDNGSYAGFANLFRYTLLARVGGLYADTDVICLTDPADMPTTPFVASEWVEDGRVQSNCNVIHSPHPAPGDLIDLALGFSERFDPAKLDWGDCGPRLMTLIAANYPRVAFPVLPPEFANPIPYWRCPDLLLTPGVELPEGARFLHCYNEMWRRAGIAKTAPFPAGSLMDHFARRYL